MNKSIQTQVINISARYNYSRLNGSITSSLASHYNIPVSVVVTLLIIILIVSLIGNSVVVLIVIKKRRMQTFTNWLILNLAVADLSVALICIPPEIPMELRQGTWIYGKTFCTVFYPIQTATIYGSVFTLVALSFSRYWAIIHPFRTQPNVFAAKILIAIIWLCSFVLIIPYMLILKHDSKENSCSEDWTDNQRRTYTIAIFILQYIVPLGVITIAYVYIIYDLCYKVTDGKIHNKDKKKRSETKQVIKLLLVITITFGVCVLPYHIVALCREFGNANNFVYIEDVAICAYIVLYINSALNPLIYNFFNAKFREAFRELYKTIAAYICSREQELEGVGFFSSRRPSVFISNSKKWSRVYHRSVDQTDAETSDDCRASISKNLLTVGYSQNNSMLTVVENGHGQNGHIEPVI